MTLFSRKNLLTSLFVLTMVGAACPQTLTGVQPAPSSVSDPVKGAGSEISSLPASSRSYFLGSLHVSTGAENNPSLLSTYSSQISPVTNLAGDFSLRKFRRHFETSIDYTGGDTLYRNYGAVEYDNQQFQHLNADEVIRWTRGQLTVKNVFSYTENREFGSLSPGGIGNPSSTESEFLGSVLFAPSFMGDVTVASVSQALSKRTSASFSAAYSFTDYLSNSEGLFNSRQASSQTGLTHRISRKTSIGVLYGYQDFEFIPNVQSVVTNSAQLVFQHRFSGHVDLSLGAGPDRIVTSGIATKSQINAIVQASLNYRLKKSALNLFYNRLVTSGSGVYAGGISDTAMVSLDRTFSRFWQATLSGSYNATSGLGVSSFGLQLPQSRYWLAGATMRRRLGPSLSAFVTYQFNYDSYLSCAGFRTCGPGTSRNVILSGIDWSIHPVHLE